MDSLHCVHFWGKPFVFHFPFKTSWRHILTNQKSAEPVRQVLSCWIKDQAIKEKQKMGKRKLLSRNLKHHRLTSCNQLYNLFASLSAIGDMIQEKLIAFFKYKENSLPLGKVLVDFLLHLLLSKATNVYHITLSRRWMPRLNLIFFFRERMVGINELQRVHCPLRKHLMSWITKGKEI